MKISRKDFVIGSPEGYSWSSLPYGLGGYDAKCIGSIWLHGLKLGLIFQSTNTGKYYTSLICESSFKSIDGIKRGLLRRIYRKPPTPLV